ncbi:hypothetical protein MMC20_007416 [Loxospora ochrophaea]|nr:hypothetical protein [Loxospora ochrophaea]
MHSSIESYCLVSSLCAFMMIQPGIKPYTNPDVQGEPLATSNTTHGVLLLEETLRVRKAYDYLETPTIATVITSFFLSAGCFGLDRHNSAWFHLREATTLTHILGMHEESSYRLDDADAPRKRRLYWLLFVTEKAYGLQKHRPTTLHESIKLPTLDEEPGEGLAIAGFIHLVNLFRPFDETFIGLWNKTRTECSTAWLAQLQRRLAEALPENLDCTESQASDLRTTQQWLRTIVWQLSITNGFLSSTSSDSSMTFGYPIDIAQDLASVSGQLTRHSMELHGIGLIEKLFDVSCTLADVMSCVPIESTTFSVGPQDYLNRFLHLISTLRGGESRYVPLLVAKINTTLPAIASSFSQPLPVAVPTERMLEQYDSSNSSLSTPFSSPNFIYEDSSPLL